MIAVAALSFVGTASAGGFKGPVVATVLKVTDGDTFLAEAEVWPGQFVRVQVRIRGVDAPEMKARCRSEREAALAARKTLSAMLAGGAVSISNIGGAKYYGRVLADVAGPDGADMAARLLESAVVRPYAGGRRQSWCG